MSTDRQRLQAAIQRIAKQDPDLSALIGAAKNRGGQASSTGVGISDSERDNLCCNGTTGGGANAGSEARDPDEDGEEGLDDTDPADLSMGQGSLTGITDCATGEPLCFDGGGFIPPDGWDGPNEFGDGEDGTFEEGKIWGSRLGGGETDINCCTSALTQAGTLSKWTPCTGLSELGVQTSHIDCEAWTTRCFDGGPTCEEKIENLKAEAQWPEDGCTNLAIAGGRIVGSKRDPENDGSYSAPRDELEVCDSSGNRILLRGSPTGGWKSINSLDGDIDPDTENGYLYRPNGQRVRQISPSEFRDDTV